MTTLVDIFIIGGGINGTAIAADAAGRGLTVALCEKKDLAAGTSSASSKLIHGGLRYLELYEFNLVRKALKEREVLMRKAPNLITPLEFILPHEKHLRPAWFIRLGLFLYDHLSKRSILPGSKKINFKNTAEGAALFASFIQGFSYYDCFTDDARLVMLNALSAKENNATILTRTKFISAIKENETWKITLQDQYTNKELFYESKVLINAAGPWINKVSEAIQESNPHAIKLDKGSHIVIPKLYEGDFAYILQNKDNRIVFLIPYQEHYTLIGTTDVVYKKELDHIHINEEEISYLCNIVNTYFTKTITPSDIIWSYAGVRCLQAEARTKASKLTRDYKLVLTFDNHPPLLTIIGGKITTHRLLAEEALSLLKRFFPHMKKAWTANTPFPYCDFPNHDFNLFYKKFRNDYPWLPEKISQRYTKNYGTAAYKILKNATQLGDLGKPFSDDLYQSEVEYLMQHEWAKNAEDILWRRTKLGLTVSKEAEEALTVFMSI
jgi:glycerol-3-phosphate dehydrogenase